MAYYSVTNPATGEQITDYPTATDVQIQRALASAESAYRQWSRTIGVAERAALIKEWPNSTPNVVKSLPVSLCVKWANPLIRRVVKSISALIFTTITPTTPRPFCGMSLSSPLSVVPPLFAVSRLAC